MCYSCDERCSDTCELYARWSRDLDGSFVKMLHVTLVVVSFERRWTGDVVVMYRQPVDRLQRTFLTWKHHTTFIAYYRNYITFLLETNLHKYSKITVEKPCTPSASPTSLRAVNNDNSEKIFTNIFEQNTYLEVRDECYKVTNTSNTYYTNSNNY